MTEAQQPNLMEQAKSIEADIKSTSAEIVDLEERLKAAREKRTNLKNILSGVNFGIQLGRQLAEEEAPEDPTREV